LQSLGLVGQARRSAQPEPHESLLRTVLQCCEIALYNMADLLRAPSVSNLSWLRGFHRVLISLSSVSARFSATAGLGDSGVRLADSPAFAEYLGALKAFDREVRESGIDMVGVVEDESLESAAFLTLHLARIGAHESTIWERQLAQTSRPCAGSDYAEFVDSATLRAAVYEHRLTGHTYFTQFRALHQIPELLAFEINDRLEVAIHSLRRGDAVAAAEDLVWINWLCEPASACLPAMIDNLATSDYHQIRENLGLTSGSHSVSIRYHLFTDLYEQFCAEVRAPAPSVLLAQLATFRAFIFGWRDAHQHLPRNHLGGDSTKSLTGSADAVGVVRRMAEHARSHDPARALLRTPVASDGELSGYHASDESLDSAVLSATGRVTQAKFTEVQERLGFFAGKCPFTKPPRRVA
jgi:tryptophan 2,3-dioxygenase